MLILIKKVGITILILDKVDFRTKIIIRNKESFHNDKVVNSSSGINSSKYLCT